MSETPLPETSATVPATPTPQASVFGTKIPSSVTFGIGVLLFFLPFLDIKCNNMVLQKVSGVQLATGFKINSPGSDNSLIGSFEKLGDNDKKASNKVEKKDPNMLAMAALILGIAAFVLSLAKIKTGGLIAGTLGAVALIATMVDVKSKLNAELPQLNKKGNDAATGFEKLGEEINISIDFAPAFYIAVIAFMAGAFFCYKWMKEGKV